MNEIKITSLDRAHWANCAEVRERLSKAGLPPSVVLDWIRARALRLRAHTIKASDEVSFDQDVPLKALSGKLDWDKGELLCLFTDYFNTEFGPMETVKSIHAIGLAFDRQQLDKLVPPDACTSISNQPGLRPGSPGKVAEWHRFWLAAMNLLNEGKIEAFKTQRELRDHLLASADLSEEAIKPHVRQIWNSFRRQDF